MMKAVRVPGRKAEKVRRAVRPEKMIVGLGNPGPAYRETRHNVGFAVVERLAAALGAPKPQPMAGALVAEVKSETPLLLVQPQTYMNRSGDAVGRLLAAFGLPLEAMLVVCDDVHLPLGVIRLRPKGSAGGHNGLRSIIAAAGGDGFPRLRIGVGAPPGGGAELADYVLSPFSAAERPVLVEVLDAAAAAAKMWWERGVEEAMGFFNGWRPSADNGRAGLS